MSRKTTLSEDCAVTKPNKEYPTSGVSAYARGTLVTTIIPTLTVNPLAKNITAAWAGVATALLNDGVTAAGVTAAVNQMFVQSPYLTATP